MPDDITTKPAPGRLGIGDTYHWTATPAEVDMSMHAPEPRRIRIATQPQTVVCDLNRTAIVVIDMQNDFCTRGGWVDHIGGEVEPDRAPIAPLRALLPQLREQGVPVIWVNWGVRPGYRQPAAEPRFTCTSQPAPASVSPRNCPTATRC